MDRFVKFNPDQVNWEKLLSGKETNKSLPETSPALKTESAEKVEKKRPTRKRVRKQEGSGKKRKTRRIKREKLLPFSLITPNTKRLHLLTKNGKTRQ